MQAERTAPERKFVLTKIGKGDYILPSNGGKTLWRIRTYTEGPSFGLTDWPADRQVWGIWRWHRPVETGSAVDVSSEAEDRWESYDLGMYDTRAEAIAGALKAKGFDDQVIADA